MRRSIDIKKSKRWVIKIGSALLTDNGLGVDQEAIADWVRQIVDLRNQGIEIVLVSSGAVAEGMVRLGLNARPESLHELQAAAAVGQMGLVSIYEDLFQQYDLHTAQVLLTHEDIASRKRYLNARQTLKALIGFNVIPIVNENDTVATDEIRFGDNDTLGGMVSNLVDADQLLILTDQDGLFTADPRHNPDATLVREIEVEDRSLDAFAQPTGGSLGRGGMATKLSAARLAARSDTDTIIANGREPDVLMRLYNNENIGSLLIAEHSGMTKRKQWLAAQQQTYGRLTLDAGAEKALVKRSKSLLAAGVTEISGGFDRGDLVICFNEADEEVARGLVNYSSEDAKRIIGKTSEEIPDILGFNNGPELISREDMVLLDL